MRPPRALLLCLLLSCGVRCKDEKAAHARTNTVVQALKPSGLRIAVPDAPGVSLVAINANINLPIDIKDRGQVSQSITQSKNGYWTLEDKSITVKAGDAIYFWIQLTAYNDDQRSRGTRVIKGLVEPSCEPSPTTVNENPACKGQVIFEENFDTFKTQTWKHTVQLSGDPDSEFTIYNVEPGNRFIKDGSLHIAATVMNEEEVTSPIKLEGCTWTREGAHYCEKKPFSWNILPSVKSAWVHTKDSFTFKYGRMEVRARAASGDWRLSRIWLEPRDNSYGPYPFDSGRVSVMRARGNQKLQDPSGEETGARRNHLGLSLATCYRVLHFGSHTDLQGEERFSDRMHVYGVTWTPEFIAIAVDGKEVYKAAPPEGGFLKHDFFKNDCENSPWKRGDLFAPFDKEFYINLAVEVGGSHTFVDNSISNGNVKPWKDNELKMNLNFWQARSKWASTWKSDLEIDEIKVWAL